MHRRSFTILSGAGLVYGLFGAGRGAAQGSFPLSRTAAEWRALLPPEAYRVLREAGTERAGTSPLDKIRAPGLYHCRGCDQPLYDARAKFDSGTGWPSFHSALPGAIGTSEDRTFLVRRTECHCSRCGGHLGHIFDDGPPPSGQRHCLNGVALRFAPA